MRRDKQETIKLNAMEKTFSRGTTREQRRDFLRRIATGAPFLGLGARGLCLNAQSPSSAMIMREREPRIWSFRFPRSTARSNELFYVRSHFAVPHVDAASHRLRVEGAVERPFEISYDELRRMASNSVQATLECAGNSRVFLIPQAGGAQWELGGVSNAVWTGVPLTALLQRAGVKADAVDGRPEFHAPGVTGDRNGRRATCDSSICRERAAEEWMLLNSHRLTTKSATLCDDRSGLREVWSGSPGAR